MLPIPAGPRLRLLLCLLCAAALSGIAFPAGGAQAPADDAKKGSAGGVQGLPAPEPGNPVVVAGVPVLPLAFQHGHLRVFGYRLGSMAYITDAKEIPPAERGCLEGLKVLALNALWWRPHPTHLSISEAIEVAQALGAERTFLTHLTHETGHADLAARLPSGITPAYDGLTVEVD